MKFIRFRFLKNEYYGLLYNQQVRLYSDAPWNGGKPLDQLISISDAVLLSPCQPGKVIAAAINYPGITGLTEKTNEPLVFIKPSSSVIGPDETIVSPFNDVLVWGECELGVVIGNKLSKATTEETQSAIFGYTIGNDVSCENVLERDHHLARSKAADTFCVLGPYIDTEFSPNQQVISGYHNESLLREGRLNERLWKEVELIKWLSTWITLEPGDVVLTGAPSRIRDREYLKSGDNFRCVIEGLGELKNSFEEVNG
jgi:2-keto-4-pentenoate hydratase/2-oxohepta-3-ene-1,7-dioic acid hydratase in catechol pathway